MIACSPGHKCTGVRSLLRDGDDRSARRDFERRQARVERILGRNPGLRTHGLNQVPGPVLKTGQEAGINYLSSPMRSAASDFNSS
jgi:hypothetical protein